ncbi:MAG: glycosyltransferase family 2 protein [Pseudomonadota bacterium]
MESNETATVNAPLVYVVILTWNDTEMTRTCLQSVLGNDYGHFKVIVVDNGSTRPCGEILQQGFPEIELVVLPENRGFTGGANAGLRAALEKKPKYIFFLNNDTEVASDAISKLVEVQEDTPTCGMATALLTSPTPEGHQKGHVVHFYSATVERNIGLHYHHHLWEPVATKDWPNVESEFVPACAILIRAKALEDVGVFDETLGTNWEDYDLCLRFVEKGWKLITVGQARVVHLFSQTTGRKSPYITYYFTRNRLICMARYASLKGIAANSITILRTFYRQVRDYGFTNWACHRAFLSAFWDFSLGRRGHDRVMRSRKG